jgi:hypothetical protein
VLAVLLSGVCFNLFKSGFVRHDPMHVFLFFAAFPCFAALFLVLPETPVQKWTAAAVCLVILVVDGAARVRQFAPPEGAPLEAYLPEGPLYLNDAIHWTQRRRAIRDISAPVIAALRLPGSLRTTIGSTAIDGYPQEMTVLFANRLNWSPRPVPQSYSAYAPDLDEMNARHYRSADGPGLVLYQFDAIDGQHPWFVDPLSLRELHNRYEVWLRLPPVLPGSRPFLMLKRRAQARGSEPEEVSTDRVSLGERVTVPRDGKFVLAAALQFRLTPGGQLRDKLWKVYPPSIRVEFADGTIESYRVVWRNAVNGLLISELPSARDPVTALWDPANRTAVTAFRLLADKADFDEYVDLAWLRTAIPAKPGT